VSRKKLNRDLRLKTGFAIPPALFKELDDQCELENRSRSNMLCQMIREYLKNAE
jgi:metal-responsive CopG/Arc/MetJ family transcriptional regulator